MTNQLTVTSLAIPYLNTINPSYPTCAHRYTHVSLPSLLVSLGITAPTPWNGPLHVRHLIPPWSCWVGPVVAALGVLKLIKFLYGLEMARFFPTRCPAVFCCLVCDKWFAVVGQCCWLAIAVIVGVRRGPLLLTIGTCPGQGPCFFSAHLLESDGIWIYRQSEWQGRV